MAWSLIEFVNDGVNLTDKQAIRLLKLHYNDTGRVVGKILLADIECVGPYGDVETKTEHIAKANQHGEFNSADIMRWLGY